jgi:endonuclease/exonuclease/phosphatase family metal-dependent hydrolase
MFPPPFLTSAHHVLLGDFNINHPNWGFLRARPDRASQLLFFLQERHHLSLLLPPETITFKKHGGESTIDVVYSSTDLVNTLATCRLKEDLDHGLDHYPLETTFLFYSHVCPHTPKPLWKKADKVGLYLKAR